MMRNLSNLLKSIYLGPIEDVFFCAICGSYLVGCERHHSDIDFVMVLNETGDRNFVQRKISEDARSEARLPLAPKLDIHVLTRAVWEDDVVLPSKPSYMFNVEHLFIPDSPQFIVRMSEEFRDEFHMNSSVLNYMSLMGFLVQINDPELYMSERARLEVNDLVSFGRIEFPCRYRNYLRDLPKKRQLTSQQADELIFRGKRMNDRRKKFFGLS